MATRTSVILKKRYDQNKSALVDAVDAARQRLCKLTKLLESSGVVSPDSDLPRVGGELDSYIEVLLTLSEAIEIAEDIEHLEAVRVTTGKV